MALLQISEPGQSLDPHQRRVAVGIDLGTTHSLVAAVRHGVAECLPATDGRVILPSVVRYLDPALGGSGRQIGFDALAAQVQDPVNTVSSVKRLMGRSRAQVVDVDKLAYTVVEQDGMAVVETVAGRKTPMEVSAEILATLRFRAEDSFDDELATDKAALQRAARACKEALSLQAVVTFSVQLAKTLVNAYRRAAALGTSSAHLTQRTLTAVRKALRDAKLGKEDIEGVVLVGGSTRMPQVRKSVASFFGREPLINLNPDEV
eukprot:gene41191-54574_t